MRNRAGIPGSTFGYGLYQMIMAFRQRARLVLERSAAYPARMLEVMAGEGVTGFPGVPTIFAVLAEMKDLSRYDLSRVPWRASAPSDLLQSLTRISGRH